MPKENRNRKLIWERTNNQLKKNAQRRKQTQKLKKKKKMLCVYGFFFLCITILLIRFYSNDRHHLIPTVQITLIYSQLIRLPGTVQRRDIGMQVC